MPAGMNLSLRYGRFCFPGNPMAGALVYAVAELSVSPASVSRDGTGTGAGSIPCPVHRYALTGSGQTRSGNLNGSAFFFFRPVFWRPVVVNRERKKWKPVVWQGRLGMTVTGEKMQGMKERFRFGDGWIEPVGMEERQAALQEALALWKRSVEATHGFLTEGDVVSLMPSVAAGWRGLPEVWRLADGAGKMVAFMGIDGDRLEMLFVDPDWRGGGIGRALVALATARRGVRRVDVNEQNPQAIGFYERMGFAVSGRSETDGEGRPFPLLHMQYGYGPERRNSGRKS